MPQFVEQQRRENQNRYVQFLICSIGVGMFDLFTFGALASYFLKLGICCGAFTMYLWLIATGCKEVWTSVLQQQNPNHSFCQLESFHQDGQMGACRRLLCKEYGNPV